MRARWKTERIVVAAVATLLLAAAAPPPQFQLEAASRLDAALMQAMAAHALPSVLLEIDRPGHAPYRFLRGPADRAAAALRRADQPFRIASLTKTFTATAILLLADRGKLDLADPLGTWFPDFPNAASITVDDLLRMRSGIAAASDEELAEQTFDHPLAPAPSLAERMAASAKLRDRFTPPGQVGVYVNLNYFILGGIIERVSGQGVGRFIAENVIRPLGLRQTDYPEADTLPGGLHGYGRGKDPALQDKTRFNPALAGAAGAMTSSAADLARYVRILCTGGLLAPATQAARMNGQALAGSATQYGQGVITGPNACGHSGTIPGFSTDMYYFPEFDATVVASVNRLDRDDKLQTVPVLTAAYTALQAELRPADYCRRVGSDEAPRPITAALQPGVQAAFAVPAEAAHGSWRCDGGRVLACIAGADLPCGKIDPAPVSPAATRWCGAHPGAAIPAPGGAVPAPGGAVPAYVTGHATAWQWRCVGRRAERGDAAWALDPAGFARTLWRPIAPP